MDYSFAPLYVRIVFFLLLGLIISVILFLWTKNSKFSFRIIVQIASACVFFACSFSTIYSLANPQLKTITCTVVSCERSAGQINLFSMDYELSCEDELLWVEFDTLTKNKTLLGFQKMESGKAYIVTYEVRENLILGVREK